jgi:hypothetical protein
MSGQVSPASGVASASASRRSNSAASASVTGAALAGSRLFHSSPMSSMRSSAERVSTAKGREAISRCMGCRRWERNRPAA